MIALSLYEELFILALREEKGKVHDTAAMSIHYGLGGALLADLALRHRVEIDPKAKVLVCESVPCGDETLDEAYLIIKDSGKLFKARHWVEEFSGNNRKLQKKISENLVTKGILRPEEQKYLWVIPYDSYPRLDASAKYWLKNQLREVLLAGKKADANAIALLNLVKACGLLQFVVTRDEQKVARLKIAQLSNDEELSKAVRDAIELIHAAATTAAMAAMID